MLLVYSIRMGYRSLLTLTVAFVLSTATPAFAAVEAGFPPASLWLSESSVRSGDTVTISTALYNSSANSVHGTVEFLVDKSVIGSSDLSLDPGKSTIASVSWTATEGSHSVAARIANASGELASAETSALSVAVAAPPPPSPTLPEQTASSVSSAVSSVIGTSSPILSSAVQNTVQLTEAVRNGIANYAAGQLAASSASSTQKQGEVLGVSTYKAPSAVNSASSWWSTFWKYLMQALLLIAKSIALFYPLLALFILFLLYLAVKMLRRPDRY